MLIIDFFLRGNKTCAKLSIILKNLGVSEMNYHKIRRQLWAGFGVGLCLLSFSLTSANAHAAFRPYFTPAKDMSASPNYRVDCLDNIFAERLQYSYTVGDTETNNFMIPKPYIKALKQVNRHSDASDAVVHNYALKAQNAVPDNYYNQILTGLQVKTSTYNQWVNNNRLTKAQHATLTLFTFNLLNHLRRQFGSPLVIINRQADKFANMVDANYDLDNFSAFNGHDYKAVNDAAKQMKLSYDKHNRSQYYEDTNVDTWFNYDQLNHIRLSDVEFRIYVAIVGMMFDDLDENQMHGVSLMGLWASEDKSTYGALGFDHVTSVQNAPGLHFFLIPGSAINTSHMQKVFRNSQFHD